MARIHIRATAAVGVLGLGLLAMSPAVAATDNQAGANAVTLNIADQPGQGSGTFTATYADGHETTSGTSKPPFSDPSGQKNLTGGVLAGRSSGETVQTISPRSPSASRPVTRMRTSGQACNRRSASSAQAWSRCSQLSSTSSNSRGRRLASRISSV